MEIIQTVINTIFAPFGNFV